MKVANANTGASTLNVNSLGTKNILNPDASSLSSGQLASGSLVMVVYDGTQFILLGGSATNTSSQSYNGFKNRIINGAMVIDQRNAGASVTPTTGTYTLDRWRAYQNVAGKFTVQQSSTAPAGFTNSTLITSTSAYTASGTDLFLFIQYIEGYNVADLGWGTANAQTVTLSFWVRSSLTGTFGGALVNGAEDRNYPFTYTISSANTFEYKTITIAGDQSGTWLKTNGLGMEVNFGIGAGSTYSGTAGAWAAGAKFTATGATSVVGTNGATFYITGVQLEKGSTATSFDYRPFTTELALCQRYFEKTYNIDVVAGTNTAVGRLAPGSASDNGNNTSVDWRFAVEKRASPTLTYYTTTGTVGSWNFERLGSSSTATVATDSFGTRGGRSYLNCGLANAPVWIYGHAVATAEL
jgi:hypothetical protein